MMITVNKLARNSMQASLEFITTLLRSLHSQFIGMDLDGLEKLTSNSLLEFNNKSVEETIIEISRWALLAIRIPGYLSLTTIRTHLGLKFELVRCSASTFYTLFITFLSIVGNSFFAYTFIEKFFLTERISQVGSDKYGNTELFVWISLLILVCYTTYLRVNRIIYCGHSLKYWKKIIRLIESFVLLDYQLNSKKLSSVYSSCRSWSCFYLLIAFGRMSYGSYNLYDNIAYSTEGLTEWDIKALFLDLFLALTLCFHVGYSIWLTFLIKLLVFCFDTIHEDLETVYCSRTKQYRMENHSGRRRSTMFSQLDSISSLIKDDSLSNTSSSHHNGSSTSEDGLIELENRIRKTLQSYASIEDVMHDFNKLFGTSIVLETVFAFIILIVNVYAGESYMEPELNLLIYIFFTMGVPIVIYSTSLYIFATECSILSGKATTMLKKLEQFFIVTDKPQLQMLQLKLVSFIARVADNPPSISALHFFSVNRHLLTSILGTITTYLIVLLQFRQASISPSANSTSLNSSPFYCPEETVWTCQCNLLRNYKIVDPQSTFNYSMANIENATEAWNI